LSDVVSGIAVDVEGPYKVGDLLWVEGGIEGHFIQSIGVSTHIVTGDEQHRHRANSSLPRPGW